MAQTRAGTWVGLSLPMLPNFVRPLFRSRDDSEPMLLDVADLTDEELRALGNEWTEALIAHANRRRRSIREGRL